MKKRIKERVEGDDENIRVGVGGAGVDFKKWKEGIEREKEKWEKCYQKKEGKMRRDNDVYIYTKIPILARKMKTRTHTSYSFQIFPFRIRLIDLLGESEAGIPN